MQFLIDTATDSPQELYKIGRFLVDQFSVVPAEQPELPNFDEIGQDAGAAIKSGPIVYATPVDVDFTKTPPPPPPPLTVSDVVGDNDPEVEFDNAGNVTAVTVSTELPAAAPGVEVDTTGAVWSAALHTSTKSKTIDGRWKPRKPRDPPAPPPPPPPPAAVTGAQNTPGNVPSTATGPAPAASAPAANASTQVPPPPPAPPSPAAPSAAIASAAPSTGIAITPLDFRGLMQKIQKATADGKLAAEQVNAALAGVGLKPEEMAQLINNAPLIASVNAAIDLCLS